MSDLEYPRFSIEELRELRRTLNSMSQWLPVAAPSEHLRGVLKNYRCWRDRLGSLIAESEEFEAEASS